VAKEAPNSAAEAGAAAGSLMIGILHVSQQAGVSAFILTAFWGKVCNSLEMCARRMYACSAGGLCIGAATELATKVSGLGRRWVPKSGTAEIGYGMSRARRSA
jgi:hypothetical protein